MHVSELIIEEGCEKRLGKAGARNVARALFAEGDCQTCVTPLEGEPVALSVEQVSSRIAAASLHHDRCQPSRWSENAAVPPAAAATYSYSYWVIETSSQLTLPVFALNPSLESVVIRPYGLTWLPGAQSQYLKDGLRPVRGDTASLPNARTMTARVDASGVLTVSTPYGGPLPCDRSAAAAPDDVIDTARRLGFVLFVVTHAADPQDLRDPDSVNQMLGDPLTVMGQVRLRT